MEAEKSTVRRFFAEAWNSKDLTLVDELISPAYVGHDVTLSNAERGPERIKRIMPSFRTAFPDPRVTVEDVVVQGDKEVVRWMACGTHQGTFMNIAPPESRSPFPGRILVVWRMDKFKRCRAIGTARVDAAARGDLLERRRRQVWLTWRATASPPG